VAFLFTDIEGSTFRWEAYPDAMKAAVRRHDALVRGSIERSGGVVFKTVGDAFCAAFSAVPDAAAAALAAQTALAAEDWRDVDGVRVRMAIHAGSADEREGDYFGPSLNRVARLLAIGHGGQILLSAAAKTLAEAALPSGASLRDLGDHGLKDISLPERVYQLVAADLIEIFVPLRSFGVVPHNLPLQITTFVGRADELDEIQRDLETARLLTLVGAGGVGKTRLGMHVGAAILDRFADGVWLVELAGVRDPDLVAAEFAAVLRAPVPPGKTVVEAVVGALSYKNLLLIVDNCEHVVGPAAALVGAILQRAQHVRIMATSRQPLHIPGEFVRRVASLGVPSTGQLRADDARTFDAVALFAERAQAATGSFVLTDENAPLVADVCRSLDGIPLAIELAAPKLTALSLRQLAERLSERLRLLAGGNRTALGRQQTLRALIDWSYDLLDEREQAMFRLLAPFAGGWTLEAAEAVCGGAGVDRADVLELLASLVEKSLVVADTSGDVPRYRFLESIREYALERLAASGEERAAQARHAFYQAAYVRDHERLSIAMEDAAWQTRMLAELDNIRSALDWTLVQQNDPRLGLEMLSRLGRWRAILLPQEALRWFGLGAQLADQVADPVLAADVLVQLATAEIHGGAPAEERIALARRAIDAARSDAGAAIQGRALITLGLCLRNAGQVDDADLAFHEAAETLESTASAEYHKAALYADWASNDLLRGDVDLARTRLQTSLSFGRGGSMTAANALATLGEIEFAAGDRSRGRALALEAKATLVELGLRLDVGVVCCNLAGYAIAADAFDEALAEISEALPILREVGSFYLTLALEHCAVLAALRGDFESALRLLGFTDAYYRSRGVVREATERAGFERARELLQKSVGPDVVAMRMGEGERMTEADALSYALAVQLQRAPALAAEG
jgi:predicted ATPase/class 3 adenylate cyclase